MNHPHRTATVRLAVAIAATVCLGLAAGRAERPVTVAFTVTAPDRAAHLFHVVMRCEDVPGDRAEFRMPTWTPGYYGIFDFAGNVRGFSAADGDTLQFDASLQGQLTMSNATLTDFQSGASVASVFITNNAGWSASVYGINLADLNAHTVFA